MKNIKKFGSNLNEGKSLKSQLSKDDLVYLDDEFYIVVELRDKEFVADHLQAKLASVTLYYNVPMEIYRRVASNK